MDSNIIGIVGLCVVGVIGDFFIDLSTKKASGMNVHWFLIGMIVYALSAFGWFYVMKTTKLEDLGALYALTTSILLVFLGIFAFGERLQPKEILGLILAFCSVILLARFH